MFFFLREVGGFVFFSNFKNSKVVGIISICLFGKDSKNEFLVLRELLIDDESYVFKVINLFFVE